MLAKDELIPIPDDTDEAVDNLFMSGDVKAEPITLVSLDCVSCVRLKICFSTSIEVEALIFASVELDRLTLLFFLDAFFIDGFFPLIGTSLKLKEDEDTDLSRLVILRFF